MTIRGGVRRLMEKAILNFPFDYLNTPISHNESCFAFPSRPASVPTAGPNIDQENNHRTYMLYPRF